MLQLNTMAHCAPRQDFVPLEMVLARLRDIMHAQRHDQVRETWPTALNSHDNRTALCCLSRTLLNRAAP